VSFGLGGNFGLGVLAPGFPVSEPIACRGISGGSPKGPTLGRLFYKAETDRYTYGWKTEASWVGTCRQLTVRLSDGSEHVAYFSFR
jgi:hypothetical protein